MCPWLQSSIPKLLTDQRQTPFTLQDGLSEWKGKGGLWIAEQSNDLLGIARLDEYRNYQGLSSFVMNPKQRGQGYGKDFLRTITTIHQPLYLRVKQENQVAIELYLSQQFKITEATDGRQTMLR